MANTSIKHVVVAMFENRSFDNLLGYLYSPSSRPVVNIPPRNPPSFNGLNFDGPWANTYYGLPVLATNPTTSWSPANNPMLVPTPDPGEGWADMQQQIFGNGTTADMSGFLANYTPLAHADGASGNQIMQGYSPSQTNVINTLAKSFAVSDEWYASVPAQTWPNRGFMHTGSADGYIDNDDYMPYDIDTIFNVLYANNVSWGVYADTLYTPALTHIQFPKLWDFIDHFSDFATFQSLCSGANDQTLPTYSFIEPRFLTEWDIGWLYPNDYHPPNNVCLSEQYLASIYNAVSSSPYRDEILLVILFDEHGGCYDHQAPATGAASPDPYPTSRDGSFTYDRFGVRIPAVLVSSYITAGTVFRAFGKTPFDHTSVLSSLNKWFGPFSNGLPSPRIAAAPTLDEVFGTSATNSWPSISSQCTVGSMDDAITLDRPVTDLEMSICVAATRYQTYRTTGSKVGAMQLDSAPIKAQIKTRRDAAEYMRKLFPKS